MQLIKLSLSLVLILNFLEMAYATIPNNCLTQLLDLARANQESLVNAPIHSLSRIEAINFARRNSLLRFITNRTNLNQQMALAINNHMAKILEVARKLNVSTEEVVSFLLKDNEISLNTAINSLDQVSPSDLSSITRSLHLHGANKLKLLSLKNFDFASVTSHSGNINEAANLFEITPIEFVLRLNRASLSLDEFFSLVAQQRLQRFELEDSQTALDRFYANARAQRRTLFAGVSEDLTRLNQLLGQDASLQSVQNTIQHVGNMSIDQAKRVYKQVARTIHLRNVARPGHGRTVRNNIVLCNLTTIMGHYQNQGLTGLGSLFTNLNAFALIEVILSNSSTKDAAYLMANPEILLTARRAVREARLNQQQLSQVKNSSQRVADFVFRLGKNASDVLRNTAHNAPGLAASSFAISLIPMTVGVAATGAVHGASDILTEGVFKSVLVSLYIGTSSNIRYNLIFDKIMPAINATNLDPKAKTALITSLFVANLMAGPYTYSFYESYANELRNYVLSENN